MALLVLAKSVGHARIASVSQHGMMPVCKVGMMPVQTIKLLSAPIGQQLPYIMHSGSAIRGIQLTLVQRF
jgi:hypothetical protein